MKKSDIFSFDLFFHLKLVLNISPPVRKESNPSFTFNSQQPGSNLYDFWNENGSLEGSKTDASVVVLKTVVLDHTSINCWLWRVWFVDTSVKLTFELSKYRNLKLSLDIRKLYLNENCHFNLLSCIETSRDRKTVEKLLYQIYMHRAFISQCKWPAIHSM